ncbi:MAG: hypothetical protein H6923_04800 [Alphaproteobacteria bacterium]|nr:hypothetical protein [Alphaproteobacteria bacterium]
MRRATMALVLGAAAIAIGTEPAAAEFIDECKAALAEEGVNGRVQIFLCQCYSQGAERSGDENMEGKLLYVLKKPKGKARDEAARDRPSTVPIFRACTNALKSRTQ